MNIGEELVASYLQNIKGCDFIQKNLYPPDVQGEIDVFGINLKERRVYVCEVTVHLVTGLQYVKAKRPNNVGKLTEKFSRDIDYTRKYFPEPEYSHCFMLWSPIVKSGQNGSLYNQMGHLDQVAIAIEQEYGVKLEFIVNEHFQKRLRELRDYAATRTEELKCPVLRLLQIEELLARHLKSKAKHVVMKA